MNRPQLLWFQKTTIVYATFSSRPQTPARNARFSKVKIKKVVEKILKKNFFYDLFAVI